MPKGKGYGVNTKRIYKKAMAKGNTKKGINYTLKANIGEGINSSKIKRMAGYGNNPVSKKASARSPARK